MGFNCLALAVLETESRLLAEGFMTTHHHNLVQTDRYKELMYRSRYAYARYFNAKYSRTGQLGENKYFSLEVEGLHHTIAALNYALRQGLHHGLTSTPFEYPHCSANAFFRKELGKPESLITFVEDRKGHDRRYAIDPTKIKTQLGWEPETRFEDGIVKTIKWYLDHKDWWEEIEPSLEKEAK